MPLYNETVGDEVFLQGKYLSIGVNSSGDIGSRYNAPTKFNTDVGYGRIGLLADLDGFDTGNAQMRDAVVRGAPIEGFNIGYKTGGTTYIHSNQEMAGLKEIAGKASSKSANGVTEADWKGATTEKLSVDQKITLAENAKYIRFEVTLTNNSTASMADLHYMRTVNPALAGGDIYTTVNKIVKQGSDGALITAGASATGTPMFLYSQDDRAVVSSYGFINESPFKDTATIAQAVGTTFKGDLPLNINFDVGTLGAGQSTTVVFYMGVTDTLTATIAEIDALGTVSVPTPVPVNAAPDAIDDKLTLVAGTSATGNVLTNDKDANGDALTAALKSGPAHGTVTLAADGSFVYKAAAGYVGADSFSYAASDGKATDTALVSITVAAPPVVQSPPVVVTKPPVVTLPVIESLSQLLQRTTTVNGNAATSDTLTGATQHNSFYLDLGAKTGVDEIVNFGRQDVLVTKGTLSDRNGDGIIAMSESKLGLDGAGSADTVTISGLSSLRYLGTDTAGLSVYANAATKPKGAIEGKISDDVLNGDAGDLKKSVFFFDTALDVHLGNDTINDFGARDLLVTTSALATTNLGSSGIVKLVGGSGDAGDKLTPGEAGTIDLHGVDGAAVQSLEFDGSVVSGDTTYYVYSLAGSLAGVADLVI